MVHAHATRTAKLRMPLVSAVAVSGLDDDVEVIGLHRVVDDAKVIAVRRADGLADEAMQAVAAKAREALGAAHGDVHRAGRRDARGRVR